MTIISKKNLKAIRSLNLFADMDRSLIEQVNAYGRKSLEYLKTGFMVGRSVYLIFENNVMLIARFADTSVVDFTIYSSKLPGNGLIAAVPGSSVLYFMHESSSTVFEMMFDCETGIEIPKIPERRELERTLKERGRNDLLEKKTLESYSLRRKIELYGDRERDQKPSFMFMSFVPSTNGLLFVEMSSKVHTTRLPNINLSTSDIYKLIRDNVTLENKRYHPQLTFKKRPLLRSKPVG